jgi:hypothetical protein
MSVAGNFKKTFLPRPLMIRPLFTSTQGGQGRAPAYNSGFKIVKSDSVTTCGSQYKVTFYGLDNKIALPAGKYYIGIKYSPKNLEGQTVNPTAKTSTYNWVTKIGGTQSDDAASIEVKPR